MFSIESVAQPAVTYLANTLLPGAALALLTWGLLRLLNPVNATTRYAILYGALLLLIGLPFLTAPQSDDVENAPTAISTPLPVVPVSAPVSPTTSAASTVAGDTTDTAVSEQPASQSQPSAAATPFRWIDMRWELPQALLLILFGVWALGAGVLLRRLAWSFIEGVYIVGNFDISIYDYKTKPGNEFFGFMEKDLTIRGTIVIEPHPAEIVRYELSEK